jgi:hypothetical protein
MAQDATGMAYVPQRGSAIGNRRSTIELEHGDCIALRFEMKMRGRTRLKHRLLL